MFLAETKVYNNFQTSIPEELIKKFNIDENTIVGWFVNDKGKIEVKFRQKKTIGDMEGIIKLDYSTDAADLKKELYAE